jgi:hypothetical protein
MGSSMHVLWKIGGNLCSCAMEECSLHSRDPDWEETDGGGGRVVEGLHMVIDEYILLCVIS